MTSRRSFFSLVAGLFGGAMAGVFAGAAAVQSRRPLVYRHDGFNWVGIDAADIRPGDTVIMIDNNRLHPCVLEPMGSEWRVSKPVTLIVEQHA